MCHVCHYGMWHFWFITKCYVFFFFFTWLKYFRKTKLPKAQLNFLADVCFIYSVFIKNFELTVFQENGGLKEELQQVFYTCADSPTEKHNPGCFPPLKKYLESLQEHAFLHHWKDNVKARLTAKLVPHCENYCLCVFFYEKAPEVRNEKTFTAD